jgi:phenylalanyl-tRNA synthetase beta chain
MKFPESWLRQLVNPPLDSEALARALTMAGLEVEAREAVAPPFTKVVVGHVRAVQAHPNADRLRVCEVDVAQPAPLTIVCGAPNVAAGQKVPCALVGAQLPGGLAIKQTSIRGQASSGMLCSQKELGLSEDSSGILVLPSEASVGQDLREYLELNDSAFTLKLTPNRGDCLSVLGVAREVAAVTGAPLNLPLIAFAPAQIQDQLRVTLTAAEGCPRYCGRVIRGVNAKAATPVWMQRALERSGLRPISPVVDVTNYVMLELGQPLHAFDLGKIEGNITVRLARLGEKLKLLNGQDVELEPDMLLIADDNKPVGLAGVMGGDNTAVSGATTDVFLESAFFAPAAIQGRARRLALNSDAGYRFERGVDFGGTLRALERASQLIAQICGGKLGPSVDEQKSLPARTAVPVRVARVARVLGVAVNQDEIANILSKLGGKIEVKDDLILVAPPTHRFDLTIEEDFIEEIARLRGYDLIPAAAPRAPSSMLPASERQRGLDLLKQRLVARDYQEIITYSFVERDWERDFAGNDAPVPLANPIASNMSVMRSSLLGGLVDALRFNLNRKQERVRVFEVGRCFEAAPGRVPGPERQPLKLAALAYGLALPEQWAAAKSFADFYDVKADLAALAAEVDFAPGAHPALHPGRCAQVSLGARAVGWLGELHPRLVQRYELGRAPVVFELDLQPLLAARVAKFTEASRFPAVRRDIAVIAEEAVPVQALLDTLRGTAPENVIDIELFDLYRGPGIEKGKKSLAFRVVIQDTSKTLADEEIEAIRRELIASLTSKHNVQLRV